MTKLSGSRAGTIALAMLATLGGGALLVQASAASAQLTYNSERLSYVFLHQGSDSSSMSGSMDELRHAKSLRSGRDALLYVRDGGAAYVIRDPATLRQAQAIFKPQEEMGARQAELGTRQAALGKRQAALGAQQARLGLQQASSTPRRQSELGRQQGELGRQQGELGRQQGILGQQQGELGREQGRLARIASEQIRQLVAASIRSGVAQRVR